MQPTAIALKLYSAKDTRNDVQHIYYDKLQLNRLVWGSLMLAPIIQHRKEIHALDLLPIVVL